jgi:molecular chaperone GrpE
MSHEEQKVEAMEQVEAQPVEPTDVDSEVTAEQARIAELEAQLEAAQQASLEERERAIRAVAEMENLRKRAEREVQNAHKFALERFFGELLPVRDSLELGLAAASENVDVNQLRAGVELTLRQLAAAMEKFGARDVNPAAGVRFNPAEHEAMAMVPTDQAEPNTVVQVVQKGYSLNERLIRPAKVLVAQAAPKPAGS